MIAPRLALLPLLALAACAGPRLSRGGETAPPPAWLVGAWVPVDAGQPVDCAGDAGVIYHADGRYEMLEEQGRWSLHDDRLTLRVTASEDPGIRIDAARSVRIRRLGTDRVEVAPPATPPALLARCPAQ